MAGGDAQLPTVRGVIFWAVAVTIVTIVEVFKLCGAIVGLDGCCVFDFRVWSATRR